MDEMYRMLSREHHQDLERKAGSRRLAATLPAKRKASSAPGVAHEPARRRWTRLQHWHWRLRPQTRAATVSGAGPAGDGV